MALAHVEFDTQDESGNLLSNVQARVELEGGGLVSIYSDRAGSTPLANPETFADGKINLYVAGGAYKITLTSGAFSRVLRYKANGLLSEKDALTAAAIAFTPAGSIAATTVQAAIEEVASEASLSAFTAASASGPASLALAEDTDNGTNKITIIAPASIASDKTFTLPDANVTLTAFIASLLNSTTVAGAQSAIGVREKLTANRTYYVRTDGSNSNDGLANTSGGAFLTIQKAITTVYGLDLGGFTATIQIADGTYATTTANNLTFDKPFMGGSVVIQGNTTTPTNVIISTTTVAVVSVTSPGVNVTITGVQFDSTSGPLVSVGVAGSNINLALVDFASTTGNHMNVAAQSTLTFTGNYSVSGGANVHWGINNGGAIIAGGRTCTISAAVAITYWAYMYNGGLANVDAMTFTGKANVTGTRYNVTTNACLQTNGGGATYLPGTIAGTTGTGGQYA